MMIAVLAFMLPEAAHWYGDFHPAAAGWHRGLEIVWPFASFYVIAALIYGKDRSMSEMLKHPIAIGRWSHGIYVFHLPPQSTLERHVVPASAPVVQIGIAFAVTVPVMLASCHQLLAGRASVYPAPPAAQRQDPVVEPIPPRAAPEMRLIPKESRIGSALDVRDQ